MKAAVLAHRRGGWRSLFSMSNQVREMSELVQHNANGRKAILVDTLGMGHHISSLQREFEKLGVDIEKMQTERRVDIEKMQNEFRVNIEKLQNEIKYEFDKLNAGRLDLNLERWRSRDELAKQGAETSELFDKLDREIHALKAQIETTKYEAIMYGIGTLVSLSVVSLAVIRMLI